MTFCQSIPGVASHSAPRASRRRRHGQTRQGEASIRYDVVRRARAARDARAARETRASCAAAAAAANRIDAASTRASARLTRERARCARSIADKYYYLAKEQGFRSRAAFKLVQLNRKYDFLSKARACMDRCAAPGGWLQVAQKYMPMSSTIVGVDLAPIRPIRGVTTLVEDITTQSCRAALKRVTPQGLKYDVVIHDGAPNVGGNFAKESYTQAALTLDSLRLATEFLGPGGWFVTKVFRSVEYHALLYAFQQLFKKVESTKPVASRGTSAEIYVVCSGYLAPTKIDPRLLDARHLFADTEAEIQPLDVTKDNGKRKRNRSGYEDGVSTLYKECTAEEFIVNEKPGEMLGSHHTFILDGKVRRRERDVFLAAIESL